MFKVEGQANKGFRQVFLSFKKDEVGQSLATYKIWRGRFLAMKKAFPCHKESLSSIGRNAFLELQKRPLYLQTIVFTPLSITSLRSVTVGSERGWGCSWVVVRLLVELYLGVSFCGFPCSVRNSVSPLGFVSSVYSVLKMPQQKTYWCFSTIELIIILNIGLWILN